MAVEEECDNVQLTGLLTHSEDELSDDGDKDVLIKSNTTNDIDNESILISRQHYCGILACRPKWLQFFARKKFFTLLLFLFALMEGAIVSGKRVALLCS